MTYIIYDRALKGHRGFNKTYFMGIEKRLWTDSLNVRHFFFFETLHNIMTTWSSWFGAVSLGHHACEMVFPFGLGSLRFRAGGLFHNVFLQFYMLDGQNSYYY